MQFSTAFIAAFVASCIGISTAAAIPGSGDRYMVPECFEPCFQQIEAVTECSQADQQCRCDSPYYQFSMVQCLSATCPTEQEWLLSIKLAFQNCKGLGLPMDYDNRAEFRGHLRNMPGFGTASSSIQIPTKPVVTKTVASGTLVYPVPTGNGTHLGPGDGPNANSTIAAPVAEYTGTEADF